MSYGQPRKGEVSPVVTEEVGPGGSIETTYEHPAFGQISVSRVSHGGGGANLYDSDFGHNHYVVVTLKKSQLRRDLSRDWHFDRSQLFEIALSESQWATFVSSFNQGGGVPCTLTWTEMDGHIPGIPSFDRSEAFHKDMRETTQEAVDGINRLIESIKVSGLSQKKQNEILEGAHKAIRSLTSSIPFVQEQFEEHVETLVERGKQEIEGYMNARINQAGLAALGSTVEPVLRIDND